MYIPGDQKRHDEIVGHLKSLASRKMIRIDEPKRSLAQNNTYWDNIDIMANHAGYTSEEMSSIVKSMITDANRLQMVNYVTTRGTVPRTVPVYRSTADLTIKEFAILIDFIFELGKKLNLTMKIPGQSTYEVEWYDAVATAKEMFQ